MSKKPPKIEETAAPYAAKKPGKQPAVPKSAEAGTGNAKHEAAFKKVADKLFLERQELLHKLAQ